MTATLTVQALLEHGRELLRAARASRDAWEQLLPRLVAAQDVMEDAHEQDRLQVAWALQYDSVSTDMELVRALLAAEIARRCEDAWQGIGETLEVLSWIVSRERCVEDVWSFAQAKLANFDTACGFDRQYLFAAGVERSIAHVRASNRPERDAVLAEMLDASGAPRFSEIEAATWLEGKNKEYGVTLEGTPLTWWIDRALSIRARDAARTLTETWAEGKERTPKFLLTLAHRLRDVEDYAGESAVRREALERLDTAWDIASELENVAAAERLAGRPDRALAELVRAAELHRVEPKWRQLGMGRMFVESCFRTALASEGPDAQRALALAAEFADVTPRLPLRALEVAVDASRHAGDREREKRYIDLRDRESKRIGRG